MDLNNKRILLTGGTGSFGHEFCRMTRGKWPECKIRVFSRDEMKQEQMERDLPGLDYYLGDVRDKDRLSLAMRGCDFVVHAAALKIVPRGERDPLEFVKTIVGGAENVIYSAVTHGCKVVALSTDKAVSPINLYGACKLTSDKLFLAANNYNMGGIPSFSVVRYGNIMGSRGSVIPLFLEQARQGGPLTITNPNCTRFMFTLPEAVRLVWKALEEKPGLHIAECKSMAVMDIAMVCWAIADKTKEMDFKSIGLRPGEKVHEDLGGLTSNLAPKMLQKELRAWILNSRQSMSQTTGFCSDSSSPEG